MLFVINLALMVQREYELVIMEKALVELLLLETEVAMGVKVTY